MDYDDRNYGKSKDPVLVFTQWVQSRSKRQKGILTGVVGVVVSRDDNVDWSFIAFNLTYLFVHRSAAVDAVADH
jgi:hypothetical protein